MDRATGSTPHTTLVLFDFFGTLVPYSPGRSGQRYDRTFQLLRSLGASSTYEGLLGPWDEALEAAERQGEESLIEYSIEELCGPFLAQVLSRPATQKEILEFWGTFLDEWNTCLVHVPEVTGMLSDLATRFSLGVVTNTHQPEFVRERLSFMDAGKHFQAVVTSLEFGRRKPCPTIFARAIALCGGQPESTVFVGDSYSADYLGAKRVGLRCLLIDPRETHPVPATDRVESILDVARMLES